MGFFSNLRNWFMGDDDDRERGASQPTWFGSADDVGDWSPLPPGWEIVSLHWHGEEPTYVRSIDDVDDSDIAGADTIRIAYTDPDSGVTIYRGVRGAEDLDGLADLIARTIAIVSP